MKETIVEQMKWLAQYAGGTCDLAVLSDEDTEVLMPKLMSELKESADAIGYDGFSGRPDSYPHIMWVMIYSAIVRPTVLEWIDENCPKAWFRLMYETVENQEVFLAEQHSPEDSNAFGELG